MASLSLTGNVLFSVPSGVVTTTGVVLGCDCGTEAAIVVWTVVVPLVAGLLSGTTAGGVVVGNGSSFV